MASLGFSGVECGAVLRVLAFVLKLGNVQFEPQHNIDGSIGVRLEQQYGELSYPANCPVNYPANCSAYYLANCPDYYPANCPANYPANCPAAKQYLDCICGCHWWCSVRDIPTGRIIPVLAAKQF